MRRYTTILFAVLGTMMLVAQVKENESALVYYMPRTELVFEIEYEQITESKGQFYQYSERYLGTKDVVLTDGVSYALRSVEIRTRTSADTTRAYTIPLNAKTLTAYAVKLTDKGILESINAESVKPSKQHKQPSEKHVPRENSCMVPLLEEQMLSGSISKMAESVAKQIYAIRENRLNLLAGDVEHTPADGEAMKLVLHELDRQESLLTQLFTGTKHSVTLKKQILITPQQSVNDYVLFRFSRYDGVLEADDMAGEPYMLTIKAERQEYVSENQKSKPAPSVIYYNMPGQAEVRLAGPDDEILAERTLPVAQFGISIPLAEELFAKRKTQVVFNTKTGMIKDIK